LTRCIEGIGGFSRRLGPQGAFPLSGFSIPAKGTLEGADLALIGAALLPLPCQHCWAWCCAAPFLAALHALD
jgi:hypothetical protein